MTDAEVEGLWERLAAALLEHDADGVRAELAAARGVMDPKTARTFVDMMDVLDDFADLIEREVAAGSTLSAERTVLALRFEALQAKIRVAMGNDPGHPLVAEQRGAAACFRVVRRRGRA